MQTESTRRNWCVNYAYTRFPYSERASHATLSAVSGEEASQTISTMLAESLVQNYRIICVYPVEASPATPAGAMIIPTEHAKNEWSRMASDAYAKDRNDYGHRYSMAATLNRGEAMNLSRYDQLQEAYRTWLAVGWAQLPTSPAPYEKA